MEQANSKRAALLAPESFQAAQKSLEKAQADSQAGKSQQKIERSLGETEGSLKKAIEAADLMSFTFPNLIKAYDDAATQKAPELAGAGFKKADDEFKAVVANLEKGDLAKARESAPEAERLLRQAELDAIKTDILGEARQLLGQAITAGSPNRTPVLFKKAQSAVQEADDFIAANRYEKDAAREKAAAAVYQCRQAIYATEWISRLKKDGENWEKLILQYEQSLDEIGATLHLQLEFDQEYDLSSEAILAAIRSLQEDRQHLQQELAERDVRIGELEAESGRLKAETGKYVAELEAKREELDRRKRLEEKIGKVRDLFKPEEGAVLQMDEKVIIRLSGLRFASGSSAIRPENFELLTKTQQAIREFPEWHIEVQGHTDSQGDDQKNQELSQKRAEAVRTYLLQNMNLSDDMISAVGLGESQPLASNDTASGRAANRRIEIVLTP